MKFNSYFYFFEYSFLKAGILITDGKLKLIDITHKKNDFIFIIRNKYPQIIEDINPFLLIIKELKEYLDGNRKNFSIKYNINGSNFEISVLNKTKTISYGKIKSYSQIAKEIKNPNAQRAVGNVLAHNQLPIIIPCHRVVRSDGSSGGFGGGISLKKRLLMHEGVKIINKKVYALNAMHG